MAEKQIYEQLRDWLKQTWNYLPEAEELLPLIQSTYTPEEAYLRTGMPFKGVNLEEDLAELKEMDSSDVREQMECDQGQCDRITMEMKEEIKDWLVGKVDAVGFAPWKYMQF